MFYKMPHAKGAKEKTEKFIGPMPLPLRRFRSPQVGGYDRFGAVCWNAPRRREILVGFFILIFQPRRTNA